VDAPRLWKNKLLLSMTKRVADDAMELAAVAKQCGPVPALEAVLFEPHMACYTVGACQLLDLVDLWNLYQCCGSTLRALCDHPDIVLYREALRDDHGDVTEALRRAFITRKDRHLFRSLRHHVAQYKARHGTYHNRRAASIPKAWDLACGLSMEYVEYLLKAMYANIQHDFHFVVDDAFALGTFEHIEAVIRRTGMTWPPSWQEITRRIHIAADYGNIHLVEALADHFSREDMPVLPEDGPDVMLYEDTAHMRQSMIFTAMIRSTSISSAEYAMRTWGDHFSEFCGGPSQWSVQPALLDVLKRMTSERRRQGLSVDWEVIYVAYMSVHDQSMAPFLKWLAPLAKGQFQTRLALDKHAKPLFMRNDERNRLRNFYLAKWGLEEKPDNDQWKTYPFCSDLRHYAYQMAPAHGIDQGNAGGNVEVMGVAAYRH
jgi:hypothetical protein